MRNKLIHGYDTVDLDILWDTVRNELPRLIEGLEQATDSATSEGVPPGKERITIRLDKDILESTACSYQTIPSRVLCRLAKRITKQSDDQSSYQGTTSVVP
jgi:hypothetical protein